MTRRRSRCAIVFAAALRLAQARSAGASTDPFIITPYDTIPNFAQAPTVRSQSSGDWSDPNTWSTGRVPARSDVVAIATGHTITISTRDAVARTIGVWAGALLRFDPDQNTRLTVGTLLVLPDGALEAGTATTPIDADHTAEIVIADQPLHTIDDGLGVYDPRQFGTALLGWGRVTIHGAPMPPTFARVAREPRAGDNTLLLDTAVSGWRTGDQLFLPDTRHLHWNEVGDGYTPQWEEVQVAAVSSDGATITLTQPLAYDHLGATDGAGRQDYLPANGQEQDRIWFRPHVINRTRNVIVRSENPRGTRGHLLLTYRADVDIRYARFQDLGRTDTFQDVDSSTFDGNGTCTHVGTNQIGRYALHMHHLMGPADAPDDRPQFVLLGNSVDAGPDSFILKWAIDLHDSHYGLVKDNVMYNAQGAGLMTEDGSESYNVIEHNAVMQTFGWGGRGDRPDLGTEGSGFWFRGTNNYVRDNVAANIMAGAPPSGGSYGYSVFPFYLGDIRVPNFKGADTSDDSQITVMNGNAIGLLEFARNEVYGATESGMTYWWLGSFGNDAFPDALESVIKDLRVWHVFNNGIFHYPSNHVTVDGLVVRGDPDVSACCSTGILLGDYMASSFVLRNADIEGMHVGVSPSTNSGGGTQTIQNSYLRNENNIGMTTLTTSAYRSDWIPPRTVIVDNVRFDAWPGAYPSNIGMWFSPDYELAWETANVIQTDVLLVFSYNQVAADDFRVFYNEQAPSFIVPQTDYSPYDPTAPRLLGSPVAGLTNAQNMATYGIAIAGAVAPCAATRDGIDGFVCPATRPPR